jgi:signal transduction histidine kinase
VIALGKLFRTTAFKISLAYLVISAIGAGLVFGLVGWQMQQLIDKQIAQTIETDVVALGDDFNEGGITQLIEAVQRRARQPGADLYLVTTHAGEPIAGNILSLPPGVLDQRGVVETDYLRAGDISAKHRAMARIFALPGGFHLLVGHDVEEGERLRNILGSALLTSLAWLVAIGTVGGLWVARRVLHRVDLINAKAQTIVAGDLAGRLPLAGTGDELDRLVQNLNSMLDRIGVLMAGMKEVSDNIAHDLKTPLTRLRAGAEQALSFAKTPEDYRPALEKIIEESDNLIRIFDALLMIARAESGATGEGMVEFDAALVARDVGELYEPLAELRGSALVLDTERGLWLHGSRELIGQALANLVDNALKYAAPEPAPEFPPEISGETSISVVDAVPRAAADKTLRLSARRVDDRIELSVADRGPGIEAQDRARVLDRFVRLETSRSRPGFGLGLSLAAAVASLHKGTLQLEDNCPGLKVVLSFPASAKAPSLVALPPAAAPALSSVRNPG